MAHPRSDDDYATTPPAADEVIAVEVNSTALGMGRPRPAPGKGGNTPSMSIRFPETMRADIHRHAQANAVPDADIIRRAVDEYLHRHPV